MKAGIMGMSAVLLLVLFCVAVYTVDGRSAREKELYDTVSSAAEESMEEGYLSWKRAESEPEKRKVLTGAAAGLLSRLGSDSHLSMEVLCLDAEQGMLDVRITQTFPHMTGKTGRASIRKTILMEEEKKRKAERDWTAPQNVIPYTGLHNSKKGGNNMKRNPFLCYGLAVSLAVTSVPVTKAAPAEQTAERQEQSSGTEAAWQEPEEERQKEAANEPEETEGGQEAQEETSGAGAVVSGGAAAVSPDAVVVPKPEKPKPGEEGGTEEKEKEPDNEKKPENEKPKRPKRPASITEEEPVDEISGEAASILAAAKEVSTSAELASAVQNASDGDTILVGKTITLTQNKINVTKNITIKPKSASCALIPKNGTNTVATAVFAVQSGATLTLAGNGTANLYLGQKDGRGSGLCENSSNVVVGSGGKLNIKAGVMVRNSRLHGVFGNSGSTITVNGGSFYSNADSGIGSYGTVVINGGSFYGNDGCGLHMNGSNGSASLTMTGGSVYENTIDGVNTAKGADATITGGKIYENKGMGISVYEKGSGSGSKLSLRGGFVYGNRGWGVYVDASGRAYIRDTEGSGRQNIGFSAYRSKTDYTAEPNTAGGIRNEGILLMGSGARIHSGEVAGLSNAGTAALQPSGSKSTDSIRLTGYSSGSGKQKGTGIVNSGTLSLYAETTVCHKNTGIQNSGSCTVYGGTVEDCKTGAGNSAGGDKGLTMSGGTVSGSTGYGIQNKEDAVCTVEDGSIESAEDAGIQNAGSLTIANGTVTALKSSGIANKGTCMLKKGTVSSTAGYGVNNSGTFKMNGGSVKSAAADKGGIHNSGSCTIENGSITGTAGYGVNNAKTLILRNGTIRAPEKAGIYNQETAVCTVAGGTVSSGSGYGINNQGGLTVKGGTVSSTGNGGIQNAAGQTATLSGGTVRGEGGSGVYNSGILHLNGTEISGSETTGITNRAGEP